MKCNSKAPFRNIKPLNIDEFDVDACLNIINFEIRESCPLNNLYNNTRFLRKYAIFLGTLLILVGFFECFLGSKYIEVTTFILVTLSTITGTAFIFYQFFEPGNLDDFIIWLVSMLSLVLGGLFSYLVIRNKRVVLGFLLGLTMGVLAGIIFYTGVTVNLHSNPRVIYKLTLLVYPVGNHDSFCRWRNSFLLLLL